MQQLKEQGLARAIGFSYHDSPELLDEILTAHSEVDYVQLQINYLDWDSISIRSRACYETAVRHGKKVLVMEPVKGGSLVNLPADAQTLLQTHSPERSPASWAIRFASSLEHVETVLSGMNHMAQIEDNMTEFPPLTREELDLLAQSAEIIRSSTAIPCTGCNYCAPNCPRSIPIPRYFSLYNEYARNPEEDWKMQNVYEALSTQFAKASACIHCKRCERNCPQKLPITQYLTQVKQAFEWES